MRPSLKNSWLNVKNLLAHPNNEVTVLIGKYEAHVFNSTPARRNTAAENPDSSSHHIMKDHFFDFILVFHLSRISMLIKPERA